MSHPTMRIKRSVIAVSAALAPMLALPGHAFGQAQDPDSNTKMERVVVTGSSIARIDGETALPVQILKREEIERTGATSTEELVKSLNRRLGHERAAAE